MKRGYSASTFILVAMLLGVLVWIGSKVNPPPVGGHDDHDEAKAAAASQPPEPKMAPMPKNIDQKSGKKVLPVEAAPTSAGLASAGSPTAVGTPTSGGAPTSGATTTMPASAKEYMDKMKAHMPMSSGAARKPDGMDAAFWREHDMGTVTPAPDPKPH